MSIKTETYESSLDKFLAVHSQNSHAIERLLQQTCATPQRSIMSPSIGGKRPLSSPNRRSSLSPLICKSRKSELGQEESLFLSHLISSNTIGQLKSTRQLPASPDRVLDAPGIVDDFYLNLLDWSARNILAVALGPSVYLWSAADGTVKELTSIAEAESYISSVSWTHDGRSIVVGRSDGLVELWDAEKNRKMRTMMISNNSQRISSLSSHRHILSTGSRDGVVSSHDLRASKHFLTVHETRGASEICGLKWNPDGEYLAAGSNDNAVYAWNVRNGMQSSDCHLFDEHKSAVRALAWCPWRPEILASGGGSLDKSIKLWDCENGLLAGQACASSSVSSLVWSRTSYELASSHGMDRNHISLWNVSRNGRDITHVSDIDNAHDARILSMCLAPDAVTIATASADESIKFWPIFPALKDKSKGPKPKKVSLLESPFAILRK